MVRYVKRFVAGVETATALGHSFKMISRTDWSLALVLCLAACAADSRARPPGPSITRAPFIAVQKPMPRDPNRILVLAALPGRVVIKNDCVLFERLHGQLVLPVFEHGVVAGRDRRGAWVFYPVSGEYFRNRTKVYAGGGGSGVTVHELARRNVLQAAIPKRCAAALTSDDVLFVDPGLHHVDFDE